jgi:PhnB protein
MLRILYQGYVQDSAAAIEAYSSAFGAKVLEQVLSPEGVNIHTELDVYGHVIALSELSPAGAKSVPGNTMQFCIHFRKDEKDVVTRAYEILSPGATVQCPLGPCFYSELMADFTDRFGIRWCLFV